MDVRALGSAVAVGLLAATVSCGGQQRPGSAPDPAAYRGCDVESLTTNGEQVARADLDGDGDDEPVLLVGSGRCAGSLVVVQDDPIGIDVRDLRLGATGARVVHLRGGGDLLMMRSGSETNEPSRPHLFRQAGNRVRELTRADGSPVLPARPTRGLPAPQGATCTPDGGITVTESRTHEPPGIVLAWDVTTTTYDLRAGRATTTRTRTLKAVAEPVLRKNQPQLYAGALFDDCG